MAKKSRKPAKKKIKHIKNFYLYFVLCLAAVILAVVGVGLKLNVNNDGSISITPNYTLSEDQIPAVLTDDKGELYEEDDIPTIEEVDGGQFEDKDIGVSVNEGDYQDLGWSEWYNTSSPEAFKNDTLNRCIYANNKYGAQCVSLARVFWWSYADRDVSTCGTGAAKGMMNCYEQNAGNDFLVYWADAKDSIQAGDWLVFTGGQYGHVGMALAPVVNGYVTLLGENQGGHYCEGGGAATNIINISIKNLIGYYRPKAYIKPEPKPEPQPIVNPCKYIDVKWGDTLSGIMKKCEGKVNWDKMDEYAKHWFSLKIKPNQSVFTGWQTGVGLFAGDRIEYR